MAKYVTVQVTRKEPPAPVGGRPGRSARSAATACRTASWSRTSTSAHTAATTTPCRPTPAWPCSPTQAASASSPRSCAPADPLEFFDLRPYPERFSEAQRETGLTEAMLAALCTISGHPAALGVMDFKFMGGSMGSVVGERFYRLAQAAVAERRAARRRGLFGRRPHAGGPVLAHADGQDRHGGAAWWARPVCPTSPSSPIPPRAGSSPASPPWPTSSWPSPAPSCSSPAARIIEQTTREKLPPDFGSSEKQLAHGPGGHGGRSPGAEGQAVALPGLPGRG